MYRTSETPELSLEEQHMVGNNNNHGQSNETFTSQWHLPVFIKCLLVFLTVKSIISYVRSILLSAEYKIRYLFWILWMRQNTGWQCSFLVPSAFIHEVLLGISCVHVSVFKIIPLDPTYFMFFFFYEIRDDPAYCKWDTIYTSANWRQWSEEFWIKLI